MYTYIYKYIYSSIHIYTHIHTYTHSYLQTHIHICIQTYMYTYTNIYIYIYKHTYEHIYIDIYIDMRHLRQSPYRQNETGDTTESPRESPPPHLPAYSWHIWNLLSSSRCIPLPRLLLPRPPPPRPWVACAHLLVFHGILLKIMFVSTYACACVRECVNKYTDTCTYSQRRA